VIQDWGILWSLLYIITKWLIVKPGHSLGGTSFFKKRILALKHIFPWKLGAQKGLSF
jgi:hypothetical protein